MLQDQRVYEVWHAVPPDFSAERPLSDFPLSFQLVGTVWAEDLDDVFAKSNHASRPWTENEGVCPKVQRPRSTSVGDVIVDVTGYTVHRVEVVGWSTKERG
jgi:hypothetical protein